MEDHSKEEHFVKILSTENVTHNVRRFTLTKPESLSIQSRAGYRYSHQSSKMERRKKTFYFYQSQRLGPS